MASKYIESFIRSKPSLLVTKEAFINYSSSGSWGVETPGIGGITGKFYNRESCFWVHGDNIEAIWKFHDANLMEHELGFDEKFVLDSNGNLQENPLGKNGSYVRDGQPYYKLTDKNPENHNYREATGQEWTNNWRRKITRLFCVKQIYS